MLAALEVHPLVFVYLSSFTLYLFPFSSAGASLLWGLLSSCSVGFSLKWFLLLWSVGCRAG